MEDVAPQCGRCPIPPAGLDGERAIRLRGSLLALGPLVGPGAVLAAFGATVRDIEMLEILETELKELTRG